MPSVRLRTNVRIRAGIRLVIEFGSFTNPDPTRTTPGSTPATAA